MSGESEVLDVESLPKSALATICANFESVKDVLSFSSTSSVLRDSCSESSAWRTLCERRWGPTALHTHLFTSPPNERCDYKALFLGINGWRRLSSNETYWNSGLPCQHRRKNRAPPSASAAAAISCSPGPLPSGGHLQACTISSNHIISILELASPKERKLFSSRRRKKENEHGDDEDEKYSRSPESNLYSSPSAAAPVVVSSYQSQVMPFHITSARPCSIKCLDYAKGIVACGDVRGSLHIVHLPPPQPPPSGSSFSSSPDPSSTFQREELSHHYTEHNNSIRRGIHQENREMATIEDNSDDDEEIEVDAFIPPPPQQYPITCFEYHRPSSRLFCLWDRGECGAWRPHDNGCVRIFDVAQQQLVSSLKEILDYYELCTILCPSSPSPPSSGPTTRESSSSRGGGGSFDEEERENHGGNELIGGTVKLSQDRWADGICPWCHPSLPASLCWHQHRSSNAALAFFDLRAGEAPGRMVNRHPLPHRSLYPRLQLVRENYLLCSHAGAPLVIWDRRFLDGGPVAIPQLVLDNYSYIKSIGGNEHSGVGEGVVPERVSNALYLSCYGSMLAGRADNGEIGVWDLSNVLGWWSSNTGSGGGKDGCGGGGGGGLGENDISNDMARLNPEQGTGSGDLLSSQWKRPVLSTYVPLTSSTVANEEEGGGGGGGEGMVVRPRAEVWIGPDWLAAPGQGRLHYFHL